MDVYVCFDFLGSRTVEESLLACKLMVALLIMYLVGLYVSSGTIYVHGSSRYGFSFCELVITVVQDVILRL